MIPPPPLVDDPAGNTAPRLESFRYPLVGQSQSNTVPATAPNSPTVVFEIDGLVREPNRQDVLVVRVFADEKYTVPVPIDPDEIPGPGFNDNTRTVRIRILGLCDTVLTTRGFHVLELYITDGTFTAGRQVSASSGRDNVTWRIECVDPFPGGDGGP